MVSIIVPVYNSERYIEDCIYSILNQSYRDIEIIIVDDGSTDSSAMLIDKIARSDNRALVFHIDNGGVARARNYGISMASGEYLAFADSDDVMENHFVEYAVDAIKEADYVSGAFTTFNDSNKTALIDYMREYPDNVSAEDYLKKMIEYQAGAYWGANWGKLYITRLVKEKHIEFEPNIKFAEDFRFNLCYLMYVQKIALLHSPCYCYRMDSQGSLSKMAREPIRYWTEYCELYERYTELYSTHGILEQSKTGMSRFLVGAYISVLMECVYFGSMPMRNAVKICRIMEGNAELNGAVENCTHIPGKIGKYARLISKQHRQVIIFDMKIRRILKRH